MNDLIIRSFNDSSIDQDEDGLLSEIEWYNLIASRLGEQFGAFLVVVAVVVVVVDCARSEVGSV